MKVHRDKLWIHACESSLSPPPNANYLITGSPGNWEIEEVAFQGMMALDSEGKPGVAYRGGVFLDEVLSFAELRDGDWQIAELIGALGFSRVDFTYVNGGEPFITFALPNSAWIEYFWRRDDEWERGIVDEPRSAGSDYRMRTVCTTTDPKGNPVLCYMTDAEGVYEELTVAWWQPETEEWLIILVDVDWSDDTWKTGYFPDLDFRNDGKLTVAYSSISQDIEPDIRYDRLIYALYDGEMWDKELVDELSCTAYSKRYQDACLMHDPLDQPVIAVSVLNEEDQSELYLFWYDEGDWHSQMLAEDGFRPSVVLDSKGTWFISYYNASTGEVIIGVYE